MNAQLTGLVKQLTGKDVDDANAFGIYTATGFVAVPVGEANPDGPNFALVASDGTSGSSTADAATMALVSSALQSTDQGVYFTLQDDGETLNSFFIFGSNNNSN